MAQPPPSTPDSKAWLPGEGARLLPLPFLAFAFAWWLLDGLVLPPVFGGTDIYYFKDAGLNLAEGLGLVSRFTFGNPGFEYQAYAQYPPLYPVLFGLFARLFGITLQVNQAFNTSTIVFTGLVGFLALRPVLLDLRGPWFRLAGYLLFVLMTTLGIYSAEFDRPDGLAVGFGILALLLASRARDFAAGTVCALALLTSPFAGIWSSLALLILLGAGALGGAGPGPALRRVLVVAAGGATALVAAFALIALFLPDWFAAFAGVVTGQQTNNETGGGYFIALLKGDVATWARAIPWGHPALAVTLARMAAALLPLLVALVLDWRQHGRRFPGIGVLALVAISPLSILLVPYQVHYVVVSAVLLAAAVACLARGLAPASRRRYGTAAALGMLGICLLSLPGEARQIVLRLGTAESLPRARAFIDAHLDEFRAPGGYLAVSPQTYMLWRERGVRPLISLYSGFEQAANRVHLRQLALDYSGSSNPLEPHRPAWLDEHEYQLKYQPQLPQSVSIPGLWTSRSSQTWESAVYARTQAPDR